MRVAFYLRRSTNEELQADSLEIQEEVLRKYAVDEGHTIVSIFRESASGRDAEGRSEFSALISMVTSGFADFDAILVRDVSRWGRFDNADESAYYEFLCIRHGVEVIYVEETFGPNAAFAAVMKANKRFIAGEFSREKSRIITYGKRRATERGYRAGAPPPFGMKRILVTDDGTYVQDLARGTHKLLSCYKTKLAPDEATAPIVRRVFTMFAVERHSFQCIQRALMADKVPAPGGQRWYISTIREILRNEAYIGVATLRSRRRDAPQARAENAYEPVIARELFLRAQFQLQRIKDRHSEPQTRRQLRLEAAAAVRKWGHLPANIIANVESRLSHPLSHANVAEVAIAIEDIFARELGDDRRATWDLLSRIGRVEEHGDVAIVNGILSVAIKTGWTRADLVDEPVMFTFDGSEWQDVIVCIGYTASPSFQRVFRGVLTGERIRGRAVNLLRHPKRISHLIPGLSSDDALLRSIRKRLYINNPAVNLRFIQVAQAHERLTLDVLQRELGWSANVLRRTYRSLCARGEPLPELKYQFGRRIAVKCSVCDRTEYLRPKRAEARRSSMCYACTKSRTQNKLLAECPECGASRLVWPCTARRMKNGLVSLCHACAMAKGRAVRAAIVSSERELRRNKYVFLHEVALTVFRRMSDQPAFFLGPVLWPISKRRKATLRWRSPRDKQYEKLILDCTYEFVEQCERLPATGGSSDCRLADSILDRRKWAGGAMDHKGERCWLVNLT